MWGEFCYLVILYVIYKKYVKIKKAFPLLPSWLGRGGIAPTHS
jgi:hypothetical protein